MAAILHYNLRHKNAPNPVGTMLSIEHTLRTLDRAVAL
jgi:hypothetical protein